jgi:hypothetical protein
LRSDDKTQLTRVRRVEQFLSEVQHHQEVPQVAWINKDLNPKNKSLIPRIRATDFSDAQILR